MIYIYIYIGLVVDRTMLSRIFGGVAAVLYLILKVINRSVAPQHSLHASTISVR